MRGCQRLGLACAVSLCPRHQFVRFNAVHMYKINNTQGERRHGAFVSVSANCADRNHLCSNARPSRKDSSQRLFRHGEPSRSCGVYLFLGDCQLQQKKNFDIPALDAWRPREGTRPLQGRACGPRLLTRRNQRIRELPVLEGQFTGNGSRLSRTKGHSAHRKIRGLPWFRGLAEWNSAIRQIGNLRYDPGDT
jgi:hypothetical protein